VKSKNTDDHGNNMNNFFIAGRVVAQTGCTVLPLEESSWIDRHKTCRASMHHFWVKICIIIRRI